MAKQQSEITAAELAEKIGTTPKELRAWLRSEGKGLGERGKRYVFTTQQAADLKRKWEAAHAEGGEDDE